MVLQLLKEDPAQIEKFSHAVLNLSKDIRYCRVCHNICDGELCRVCSDSSRDHELVCCVQDIRDVMAIENTGQYKGVYHVLGNLISPVDGIGPDNLTIDALTRRAEKGNIREILFALSSTMEGDTTMFYIARQLQPHGIKISTIARGISIGGELEYTDEITLGRSIQSRVPYNTEAS